MIKLTILIFLIFLLNGCAIKSEYLIEQKYKEEAQQEIKERKEEWNWKNRHRLRKEKRERLEKEQQ